METDYEVLQVRPIQLPIKHHVSLHHVLLHQVREVVEGLPLYERLKKTFYTLFN